LSAKAGTDAIVAAPVRIASIVLFSFMIDSFRDLVREQRAVEDHCRHAGSNVCNGW
jgi:hypothetical protein